MIKCKWCGRQISKKLTQETHTCRSKKLYEKISDVEEQIVECILKGHSLLHIAKHSKLMFGVELSRKNLEYICKWHNLKIPNIKQSANSITTRAEYKKTMLEKYGVENVSQASKIKDKKNQTNIFRYGVTNPFQRDCVKEQSRATMLRKYGVENPIHLPRIKSNGRLSKPHKKVSNLLSSLGIDHINDATGKFPKYNDFLNRIYCPIPDIFIPEKNLVIEIYGTRWHMDPRIYSASDVVRFFIGERTAQEIWNIDADRISHIKSFGVDVEIIWEHDIKTNWDNVVKQIKNL